MNLLVIGSQGQLARSLVEHARGRSEFSLTAIGRPQIDLEKPGSAAEIIAAMRPDIVINAAGYTAVDQAEAEPERAFRVNAEAAGEIAGAAAKVDAPVIHISTDYVFDGRADRPYDEEAPTNPLNVYGKSKLAGEEQVRRENPKHLIVRTAWVYSPFGHNFIKSMMAAAEKRAELRVVEDQRGNPTSALDLAKGILGMISALRDAPTRLGKTYHLAGFGVASWYEFAVAILEERERLGLPTAEVLPIASSEWPSAAARPANSVLDCAKAYRGFGIRLPLWSNSVREIVRRLASETKA